MPPAPAAPLAACCACRHLHIPLVQAERAWAYAMDLKSHLEEAAAGAQKRQHLVRRLAKAASHSAELVALTAARCDARTQVRKRAAGCLLPLLLCWKRSTARTALEVAQCCTSTLAVPARLPACPMYLPAHLFSLLLQLEAEAYSLWMSGSVLLEKESDWEGALGRFLRARWAPHADVAGENSGFQLCCGIAGRASRHPFWPLLLS